MLAFLAQDADKRVFCYGNAAVRKEDQNDKILRFIDYWRERTGRLPQELVFDSQLTTCGNLSRLNELSIQFITLRRRDAKMPPGDAPAAGLRLAAYRAGEYCTRLSDTTDSGWP